MNKIIILALSLTLSQISLAQSKSKKAVSPTLTPVKSEPAHSAYSSGFSSSYSSYSSDEKEIQVGLGHGSLVAVGSTTTIDARASFAKKYDSQFQIGGEGSYYSTSGVSSFEIFGFGNYNLDTDLKNSLYGKAGAGMFSVSNATGGRDSKFGFMIGGGKRLPLWDRIAYNPEVRIYKKGDADTITELQFLNLSIMY